MAEWEIEKPQEQCAGTGNNIECGEDYFAALVEIEGGLARKDYSVEYWESEKPEVYCFWKTRLPKSDEKKHIFVDDEMLMAFFDRLKEETEAEKVNFRFVLTLILMRKRRLKYDSTKIEDGKEVWRLKRMSDKEFDEVVNPNLDEQQIEQLSSQVGQILQVNL
ncbi:MAG: hypothetical protein FVQ80_10345 [Planctomycetes bacterium]|nr:hypothetical protein [Planctomycetota bacterium]